MAGYFFWPKVDDRAGCSVWANRAVIAKGNESDASDDRVFSVVALWDKRHDFRLFIAEFHRETQKNLRPLLYDRIYDNRRGHTARAAIIRVFKAWRFRFPPKLTFEIAQNSHEF